MSAEQYREMARRALPPVEGELRLPGLRDPVEVIRDRWGVPHIYASNPDDLFFAQAFVQASERFFQQDFFARLGAGRLSELFSGMTVDLDRFTRTVGFNRAGARLAASYDERSVAMTEASIAGSRAWLERMPEKPIEYQILDLEPHISDSDEEVVAGGAAAGVFMAWILSTNWDAELLRVEIAERLGFEAMLELFPDVANESPIVIAGKDAGEAGRRRALDILKSAPIVPKGQGSNNWVVSGSRTVSGKPILCNDPHLLVQMPSIWFEVHLSCPGYEASGVAMPFSPGVIIGHTPHHAWGFTNVGGDTQDLYLEKLSEDGSSALHGGEWEPLTVHREEIAVRGSDPIVLEVRESRHGPVLDSYMVGVTSPEIRPIVGETYALRWTGLEKTIAPSTVWNVATARSFRDFRRAVSTWHTPGQNMVYADVDGTIGYQCTGLYPLRRKGDGTVPVPGWTDEYEWDGYIPFEELPWSENPECGFLVTANEKIHDDSYPYLIGKDFLPPFRARRIVERITAVEKHTRETLGAIHMDTVSLPAREMLPHLLEVEPADDRQKEALSYMAGWDGDLAADSVAACIYEVWCKHIAEQVLRPRLGDELFSHFHGRRQWTNAFQYQVLPNLLAYPTATWFGRDGREGRDEVLRAALAAAIDELTGRLSEDMSGWRWGAIHKARFASQLAMIPDLTDLFTAGEVEIGGDEQTILQGLFEPEVGYDAVVVPSWRQIVDLSDLDASVGIHTTGQSGNPASPHFRDFVEPWSKGEYHPLPMSRGAVEGHAEATLRLEPG